jgi:hypothetical protein
MLKRNRPTCSNLGVTDCETFCKSGSDWGAAAVADRTTPRRNWVTSYPEGAFYDPRGLVWQRFAASSQQSTARQRRDVNRNWVPHWRECLSCPETKSGRWNTKMVCSVIQMYDAIGDECI